MPQLTSVRELFARPLLDLVFEAAAVHRSHHDPSEMQRCTLLSIKTGGCPEDCAYCAQSARFRTAVDAEPQPIRAIPLIANVTWTAIVDAVRRLLRRSPT